MITDRLSNADHYRNIHPRLAAGLDWLRATDLASLGRVVQVCRAAPNRFAFP